MSWRAFCVKIPPFLGGEKRPLRCPPPTAARQEPGLGCRGWSASVLGSSGADATLGLCFWSLEGPVWVQHREPRSCCPRGARSALRGAARPLAVELELQKPLGCMINEQYRFKITAGCAAQEKHRCCGHGWDGFTSK